jgi:hypothetical protein
MHTVEPYGLRVASEKDLVGAFDRHLADGYGGILLSAEDGSGLLAVGEGFGPYTLEWFAADWKKSGTHLRATEELKSAEVLRALVAFRQGDPSWREPYAWVEVENEPPTWPDRALQWVYNRLGRRGGEAATPGDS